MTLRALDPFCGIGGTGMGLYKAGFDVTGIDIVARPNYPFKFVLGDAVSYIREHGHKYDLIVAGPPCQADCALTAGTNQYLVEADLQLFGRDRYVSLLEPTRDACLSTGRPFILEQPIGPAVMRTDVRLCGLMFDGLKVLRHRKFELHGLPIPKPVHPSHKGHRVSGWRHGVFYEGDMVAVYGDGGGKGSVADWQDAMGIDWTDIRKEISEAIPPAYSEYLGIHAMAHLLGHGSPQTDALMVE